MVAVDRLPGGGRCRLVVLATGKLTITRAKGDADIFTDALFLAVTVKWRHRAWWGKA